MNTCNIKIMAYLKDNSFVQKHLYPYPWISGSSTKVHPIQEQQDGIVIQWQSNRSCQKWIDKTVSKFADIIDCGYLRKSDGSCPNSIFLKYKK